jgi:adenylate cyclase
MAAEELAEESGVDLELARRLRRAMGLPDVAEGEPAFFEADLEALRRVKVLIDEDVLDNEGLLHMARTLGLASARMADAVVGFWSDRFFDQKPRPDDVRLAATFSAQRMDELEKVVGYLFRRHLLDSVSRRIGMAGAPPGGAPVAVGFADLVGFTSLAEQLSDRETAELIERFERLATDQVVGAGGRVVKMIGDEVMFVADPAHVSEIALALSETFGSPELPSVRVGVAAGSVVAQGGDLFGPVVNLASRATVAAHPGTVLISPSLAEILSHDERYEIVPVRPHKLKGIGVVPLSVLRRAKRQ